MLTKIIAPDNGPLNLYNAFSMQLPKHFPNIPVREALCSQVYTMDGFCSLFKVTQLLEPESLLSEPGCSLLFSAA